VPAPSREPFHAQRADALAEIAESYLHRAPASAATADRYQVVVHVSAETLKEDADVSAETSTHINAGISHLEDGPHVSAETSRRIACDCSRIPLLEDDHGEPRPSAANPARFRLPYRRALRARDEGCRFPGCTHKYFIDGHHIRHWADGGETSLNNLVQLCRRHHRMVHEGGVSCERMPDGRIAFKDRWGLALSDAAVLPAIDNDREARAWLTARFSDLEIDEHSCVPKWYAGETIDWNRAVGNLFQ